MSSLPDHDQTPPPHPFGLPRMVWLRRWLCMGVLALGAATWPLWTTSTEIPQIPWTRLLIGSPGWADPLLVAATVLAALVGLCGPTSRRVTQCAMAVLVVSGTGLVLLDQHRLQPWSWEFLLLAWIIAWAPSRTGLGCARALVISVYTYSAISKLDIAFLEAHGQLLLEGLLRGLGSDVGRLSPQARTLLVAAFPVGELLVAVLLAWPRLRFFGGLGSFLLHGLLIVTLGPWGLNHEWGVILWNLFFIGQNALLFMGDATEIDGRQQSESPAADSAPNAGSRGTSRSEAIAVGSTALFVLLPLGELIGRWDHWPAWAVYCARPARVRVEIDTAVVDRLPPSAQRHVGPPLPLSDWRPFSLDGWSFEERSVPPYPQLRYRLAVIAEVARRARLEEAIRVEIAGTPDRFSGERSETTLNGTEEISDFLARFEINTDARRDAGFDR